MIATAEKLRYVRLQGDCFLVFRAMSGIRAVPTTGNRRFSRCILPKPCSSSSLTVPLLCYSNDCHIGSIHESADDGSSARPSPAFCQQCIVFRSVVTM